MIADLSVNYVERFALEEGHVLYRLVPDYGYDLAMLTFDAGGELEPGLVYWQLKASESYSLTRGAIAFDLDIRDYNVWMRERMPVVLALYDASLRRAYWLDVQDYFRGATRRSPRPGAKHVRVHVPGHQTVNRRAIRHLTQRKRIAVGPVI
jgi:hypothetical protein